MNNVNLIGRIVRDPEIRYTGDGNKKAIAQYTLAVDRYTANEGNQTDFIKCVCFGTAAAFAEKFLKKGQQIGVNGSIKTGSYTNKDGVKVYTTEVWVSSHTFCGGRKESGESENPYPGMN